MMYSQLESISLFNQEATASHPRESQYCPTKGINTPFPHPPYIGRKDLLFNLHVLLTQTMGKVSTCAIGAKIATIEACLSGLGKNWIG